MTTSIPDSWEMPAYLAGDLVPMNKYRNRDRVSIDGDPSWEEGEGAPVVTHPSWSIRRGPAAPPPEPVESWTRAPQAEMKPFDPSDYPDRDFYDQADLDHLEQHGFYQTQPGVWERQVTTDEGQPRQMHHVLTYDPGHRRPTTNERAPWILTTHPETVGIAFPSLRGNRGAMAAANADRDAIRRMSKLGAFLRHLTKTAVEKTPAQIAAEKWLADNPEGFEEWHPEQEHARPGVNYSDFMDAASGIHNDDEEGTTNRVMPGSGYDWERGTWAGQDEGHGGEGGWSPTDDESGDPQPHEQDLADLGFNWQNRGDENTTPVGEYLEGEYVRHQHDPEGRHVATHTIRRVPYSNTWHVESTDPSDSNFAYESSEHRFPHDAISRYHDNAERALLPTRGYEPHRGRSGAITHWTRTDTDPHSGQTYEHEIENQPGEGERTGMGWLGHTVSEGMIAPSYGTGALRRPDLADVVREQDRTGRGLHPGGSQDYRTTKAELLADPSVARLGAPTWVADGDHYGGKVGTAMWKLPHPNPPRQTVFDPTAPGYAREVESDAPWINAEARYNWDKGGYDFHYSHNGERIYPTSEHFPAGAPVHVPGRQTQLPLEH